MAIGERTGLASFGVVPYFERAALLPAEDSLALAPHPVPLPVNGERERGGGISPSPRGRGEGRGEGPSGQRAIRVAVPLLPYIANFDDLDPLAAEPAVELLRVGPGTPLPRDAALIILPGSKATLADLAALRREGWDIDIAAHRRHGGHILGLCGGYQMLGRRIADPDGREGPTGEAAGLGLLEIDTVLGGDKRLGETQGIDIASGAPVHGYEIHLGKTSGPGLARPMLELAGGRRDGAVSPDGRIMGCYLHGLFASDAFRRGFLARLGAAGGGIRYDAMIEDVLDALAAHLDRHLDLAALLAAAQPPRLILAA